MTPASLLRFDCCAAVSGDVVRGEDNIGIATVLGGRYAIAVHRGSFATLGETYRWLARDYVPSVGLRLRRAAAVEVYLTAAERRGGGWAYRGDAAGGAGVMAA